MIIKQAVLTALHEALANIEERYHNDTRALQKAQQRVLAKFAQALDEKKAKKITQAL